MAKTVFYTATTLDGYPLAKQGLALKPGDLVSLGSFSKLMPTKPGLAVQVVYQGLPGTPMVAVKFK